jgi:hypothetical protein
LLAPVFARVENWDGQLVKLRAFWSSVVLMSGRYQGQPMQAHFPLTIEPQHFDRWLALFEQSTADVVLQTSLPCGQGWFYRRVVIHDPDHKASEFMIGFIYREKAAS